MTQLVVKELLFCLLFMESVDKFLALLEKGGFLLPNYLFLRFRFGVIERPAGLGKSQPLSGHLLAMA